MITVKKYIEAIDKTEYDIYIKYSSKTKISFDVLGIGSIYDKSFDDVKTLQTEINNFSFYRSIYWFDKFGIKNIGDKDLFDAIQTYNYLKDSIIETINIERELLSNNLDSDLIAADTSELEELGYYLQYRSIAKELNVTLNFVKRMKYSEAFLELLTQKRIKDYEQRLFNIKTKKH